MANKKIRFTDVALQENVDIVAVDNGDGTYSLGVAGTAAGASIPAGANFIGVVGPDHFEVTLTATVQAAAFGAGDILFDRTALANAMRDIDANGRLEQITAVDRADQTAADMQLVFLSADVSLGTANSAPSISDDNASSIIGIVTIPAASWIDVGGAKIATVNLSNAGLPLVCTPATGTRTVYVAGITQGTPTYAATTDLRFRFWFANGN